MRKPDPLIRLAVPLPPSSVKPLAVDNGCVFDCKARETDFLEMVAGLVALARFALVHFQCYPPSPLSTVAVTQLQLQT
jgi:hypothetical protein